MANLNNNVKIGQNIKDIRQGLELTQEEFAEKLNINAQFLSQVETGRAGISMDNAINICNTAKCSSTLLFKNIIKTPDIIENYSLLNNRDKSIVEQMILYLLNTK
ncbi:MAG: helix-turn-helix transcriptional regulator [Clostridia bacterium]|nr:helix-turn-helix transcriptional regulator [Clostridia bacterium]